MNVVLDKRINVGQQSWGRHFCLVYEEGIIEGQGGFVEREEQSEIPEPRCKSVGKPSGGRRKRGSLKQQ